MQQGLGIKKFENSFHFFYYRRHCELFFISKIGLKSFLQHGLSEPELNGDLVYKLRKIVNRLDFLISSEKLSY